MTHGTDSASVAISAVAIAVALVAGVRSTWSPCGISMLSTVTPLAEKGRGHRWSATATLYLTGSIAGGATLGAALALLAAGVHALANTVTTTSAVVAATITLVAAASETGIVALPIHHRQVNERWLDAYRPWVYATGFGWQIGTGVATYIKTSAVYVLIALAALTGNPLLALAVGILFGLVRGLAVYASRGITSASALASFHRRFTELDRPARATVVVVELAAAAVLSWLVSPWLAAAVVVVRRRPRRRRQQTRRPVPPPARTTESERGPKSKPGSDPDRSPRRRRARRPGYIPRWFSNRAYCLRNSRFAFPVGPFRCLATSISASSARSIGTSSLYSDSR